MQILSVPDPFSLHSQCGCGLKDVGVVTVVWAWSQECRHNHKGVGIITRVWVWSQEWVCSVASFWLVFQGWSVVCSDVWICTVLFMHNYCKKIWCTSTLLSQDSRGMEDLEYAYHYNRV